MNLQKKSIKVLKDLQLKNGCILATPSTGAYPYLYTRDAVIVTKALNSVGLVNKSEKFYYFFKKSSKVDHYNEVFQRYNSNGLPAVSRRYENDNEGLILHGIYDTYLHNKMETFIENLWSLVETTVKLIFSYSKSGLVNTKRSIHEYEGLEKGNEIWANCACCRGLYDAAEMARILNYKKKHKKWKAKAEEIHKNINKKLFNKKLGVYSKSDKIKDSPDMSQLAPFYFELSASKTILKNTMNYLKKHIWDKELGGFKRFRKFEIVKDWHWYTGGSGSWVVLTCWGAKFYKQLGDTKEYNKCIKWIEEIASKSQNFLPEHIATEKEYEEWKSHEIEFNNRIINETKKADKYKKNFKNKRIVYWATPLAWSHAEYVLLKNEKKRKK